MIPHTTHQQHHKIHQMIQQLAALLGILIEAVGEIQQAGHVDSTAVHKHANRPYHSSPECQHRCS